MRPTISGGGVLFIVVAATAACLLETLPRASAQRPFQRRRSRVDLRAAGRKDNPAVLAAFGPVVAGAAESTVQVCRAGEDAALGTVVGADGWILTQGGELAGPVTCRLANGRAYDARLVGLERGTGLALLKIEARGLRPVAWSDGAALPAGSWVATPAPGGGPIAVGVICGPPARSTGGPRPPRRGRAPISASSSARPMKASRSPGCSPGRPPTSPASGPATWSPPSGPGP